jgi:hypothetical protein
MRSIDLALYADRLAGEAAAIAARLDRARSRVSQAAIERAAREELPPATVARLETLGFLTTHADRRDVHQLADALATVEELQAWVESRLASAE